MSGTRDMRADPRDTPPWRRHLLRRDGRRALAVSAVEIVETHGDLAAGNPELAPLDYRFRLLLLAGGSIVAAVSITPRPDLPGRPVFRAEPIADAQGLARFLDAARPSLCFSLLPGSPAALAARSLTGIPAPGFRFPDVSGVRTAA